MVKSRTQKKGNKRACSWVTESQAHQVRGRTRLWGRRSLCWPGKLDPTPIKLAPPTKEQVKYITVLSYIVASNAANFNRNLIIDKNTHPGQGT